MAGAGSWADPTLGEWKAAFETAGGGAPHPHTLVVLESSCPDPKGVALLARRIVTVLLLGLLGLGGVVVMTFDPWRGGQITGAPGALEDPLEGLGPAFRFRYAGWSAYTTLASVSNQGPVAFTLVGLADADASATEQGLLRPTALYVAGGPHGGVDIPRASAVEVVPFTVRPGEVYALWVDWSVLRPCTGGRPGLADGESVDAGPGLPIQWTLAALPRTSTVDIGYRVVVENPLDDPVETCGVPG